MTKVYDMSEDGFVAILRREIWVRQNDYRAKLKYCRLIVDRLVKHYPEWNEILKERLIKGTL